MRLTTGLLLLSVAVLFSDAGYAVFRLGRISPVILLRLFMCLWCATFGIWFLLPHTFANSLERWGSGPRRLILDIVLVLTLIWLALYWLFLSAMVRSFPAVPLPPKVIVAIGTIWCVGYLTAFVTPAFAFPASTKTAQASSELGTSSQAPINETAPAEPIRGYKRWLMMLASVPLFGGGLSLKFVTWLPSPETLVLANKWWWVAVLSVLLATTVSLHGHGRLPGGEQSRSIAHTKLKLISIVMAFTAMAMTSFLTMAVPKVWSFAEPLKQVHVEVVLVNRLNNSKERRCKYGGTVAYSVAPDRRATICGLQPAVWDELVPGDRLLVIGEGNRWGMIPKRVGIMH